MTNVPRFWSKVNKTETCWLWTGGRDVNGYGRVREERKLKSVHRVSWELTNGAIPAGMCVLHKCDTPACVNPAHLSLGSQADNIRDRNEKGRTASGERHACAKVTEAQVFEIIALRQQGMLYREIGDLYGLGEDQVSRIVRGLRWKHIGRVEKLSSGRNATIWERK